MKSEILDFSASINPFGLPSTAREAIRKNLCFLTRYPQAQSEELKKALADFHNIRPDSVLIGNGSIELIHLIPRALKIKKALVITPTFSEYEFSLKINQSQCVFAKLEEKNGFKVNSAEIKKLIPKVDLIFLCNPNNPTGSLFPRAAILDWLSLCKKHNTILAIDEAFMDFVNNPKLKTLANMISESKQLIIIKSLTKFFSIPGLRLGYLIAHNSLVKRMLQYQYPWNINSLAQAVSKEVIRDSVYINKSRKFILREKDWLFKSLAKINGLKVFYPDANFIFCKLENSNVKNTTELEKRLLKRGIIIRACRNFRGLDDSYFRVGIRLKNENLKLISTLKEALK